MKHKMELLLSIEDLNDIVNSSWDASFTPEEIETIGERVGFDTKHISFSRVNIGPGADVLVILSTIVLVKDLLLLPPSVLRGLKDWKKMVGWLKGLIKKKELVSGDETFAEILARDYLVRRFKSERFKLVDSHTIRLEDFSSIINSKESKLPKHPYCYYIRSYQLDNGRTIVLGIKSTGEVNLIKAFEWNPYGLMEVEEKKGKTK